MEEAKKYLNQNYFGKKPQSDLYKVIQEYAYQQSKNKDERIKELEKLVEEVMSIWEEDGEGGNIQMNTPIAWYRAIRIAEELI